MLFCFRNCLFRALNDQLEGHTRNHLKYRYETVQYMKEHRNDFEPFVEDDVPFDQHRKCPGSHVRPFGKLCLTVRRYTGARSRFGDAA